jgi:hypothetical protein
MESLFGGGLGVSTEAGEMRGADRPPELDWGAYQCGMAAEFSGMTLPLNILFVADSAGLLDCKPQPIK